MRDTVKQAEMADGFDRDAVEEALAAAVARRIGMRPDFLPSANPGVLAICRLDFRDADAVDWQEVVSEVAREAGHPVVCVANADWTSDDGPDEEATWIAFGIPSLPGDYRGDFRNEIVAVTPQDAPPPEHFAEYRAACSVLSARIRELDARAAALASSKLWDPQVEAALEAETFRTRKAEVSLTVWDRAAVQALIALDYAAGLAAMPES